ncbi:hypothetical protein CNE_1c27250 [Cupriavidus necator N-1]|uniref:Uncharacterized protein n=1 Tax=Cupriavidus necator (strain ATCC 43291 / DSM 13513 / CCUG 52238 / LMG 8453 / N-1) TaxID=1042878 RepID=G0ET34_CUPNN|nr:hypothetical protein CNE_1c27250 [Cupriavidus necator N-1]
MIFFYTNISYGNSQHQTAMPPQQCIYFAKQKIQASTGF